MAQESMAATPLCALTSRLPLELRHQVYHHLLDERTCMWPVASVGFASVSHWPPPTELLSIHPQITRELRDYFYRLVTVRFTLGCAFQQWQFYKFLRFPDAEKRHLRNVEVLFIIGHQTVNTSEEVLCRDLLHRVRRLRGHFAGMPQLKAIVVNWTDWTGTGFGEMKAGILVEFGQLRAVKALKSRSICFTVGEISVPDEEERDEISATIKSLMAGPEIERLG